MRIRSASLLARFAGCAAFAVVSAGCQQQGNASEEQPSAGGLPSGIDACRLLNRKEVGAVFSGAESGEVDQSRQQYGISACTWSTPRGTFIAQYWKSNGATAKDEASGLMLGVLDPLKGEAVRNNIRYENVADVGDQAVAAIETEDATRGVLSDMAILVAKRGDQILVLMAPELARAERGKALRDLQALGKSAVGRL